MFIADMLGWWYSRGFAWAAHELFVATPKKISSFFSISDLTRTLFAPFRQDSLQAKNAPVGVKLQLLLGNIISRIFGFIVRTTLIVTGLVLLFLDIVIGGVLVLVWPLVPLAPVIAVTLTLTGVGV